MARQKLFRLKNYPPISHFDLIIGESLAMQEVYRLISQAIETDVTVSIIGETGTGKELTARAIHYCGARKSKPFVPVNCSAIPKGLLERELFGNKRGAFTGAEEDCPGLFQEADEGALFIDEISEMNLSMQVKLLRALDLGEIRPVGFSSPIKVNARFISATNRNLKVEVESGRFREDLFYRLNHFPIHIPPLRERQEDIPILAGYFLEEAARKFERSIEEFNTEAMELLMRYHWPGNVRELKNEVERAVLLANERKIITPELLSNPLKGISDLALNFSTSAITLPEALDCLKRRMILDALRRTNANKTQAAKILGISRQNLQRFIKHLGIEVHTWFLLQLCEGGEP